MNHVVMTGKFYGHLKSNIRRGQEPAGEKLWAQFSVGVYNFFKREVEFFPCVAFGKTAERVVNFHGDKRWVNISGELRHEKNEKDGRKFNNYKIQVWTIEVPLPDEASNRTEGEKREPSPPEAAGPTTLDGSTDTGAKDALPF